jgi:hypothetical protein
MLWIQYYYDIFPDKNEQYAPIYYTLKDLHQNFCINGEIKFNISGLLLYDSFRNFWHTFFKFVKFSDWNYLGKCDICMEIKLIKSKVTLPLSDTETLKN